MKSQRLETVGIGLCVICLALFIGGQSQPQQTPTGPSGGQAIAFQPPVDQSPAMQKPASSENAAADPDPARFAKTIERFERWDAKNAWPQRPVLFVGSSSIVMWKTRECFPRLPVINRGFGGSHISDVNHYFDRVVKPYQARLIVFYAGDNDVAAGKGAEQVLEDYCEFVRKARELDADTPVIYVPIKPSTARWKHWPTMRAANELIRQMSAADEKLYFADTATPTLGADGTPRKELLLDDGLHLSDAGYKLWTSIVKPVIERALKSNE